MTRIGKFFQGVRESILLSPYTSTPREVKREKILARIEENKLVVDAMHNSDSDYISKFYYQTRITDLEAELSKLKEKK